MYKEGTISVLFAHFVIVAEFIVPYLVILVHKQETGTRTFDNT